MVWSGGLKREFVPCQVEAKKAVPKEEHQAKKQSGEITSQRSRKVFVGGLAPSVDEKAFRDYFERYGQVKDAVVMYDHENKRPRGFGFVTFQDDESVAKVFNNGVMQTLHDKKIEIKHAVPRDQMTTSRGGTPGASFPQRPGFPPARGGAPAAAYAYQNQFAVSPTGGYPPAAARGGFAKYPTAVPGGRGSMLASMGPGGVTMNTGYGPIGPNDARAMRPDSMQLGLGPSLGARGGVSPGMATSMGPMPGVNSGFGGGLGNYGVNAGMGYNMGSGPGFSGVDGGLGDGSVSGSFGGSMNGYGLQAGHMQSGSLGSGISAQQGKVSSNMNPGNFGQISGHSPTSGYGGFSPTGQSGVPGMQNATPRSGFMGTEGDLDARKLSLNVGNGSVVSGAPGLSYDGSATFSEGPAPGWSS